MSFLKRIRDNAFGFVATLVATAYLSTVFLYVGLWTAVLTLIGKGQQTSAVWTSVFKGVRQMNECS